MSKYSPPQVFLTSVDYVQLACKFDHQQGRFRPENAICSHGVPHTLINTISNQLAASSNGYAPEIALTAPRSPQHPMLHSPTAPCTRYAKRQVFLPFDWLVLVVQHQA